ncbi:MAG: hypothetical protein ACFB21_11950, partial [Opitutales bacterium]
PSLLIFFFDDAEGVKTGIAVDADESWSSGKPHVHYRWRNADGEVESDLRPPPRPGAQAESPL